MSARPIAVFAAACVALLLAAGASAQTMTQVVNRFATVRSADGYLNLRADRVFGGGVEARIPNGERVLVKQCGAGRAGQRWCIVQRGAYRRTGEHVPGFDGVVYDAELVYEPARQTLDDTMAGAGVWRGITQDGVDGYVRSDDGYTNLRAGPGTRYPVLRRVPNSTSVMAYACADGNSRETWCIAEVNAGGDPQSPSGQIGYVYLSELSYN